MKGTNDNSTYDISAAHRAFLLGATRSVAPQSTNQSMGSGATHRSRVGSARAHVCTPTHMNVSINTTFERPSSTAVAAHSLPSPPPLACLLGPQFDSARRLAAAAAARSLSNTAYDIINTIHDFCFIFTCVFNILYYLYLYYLYYFTLDNRFYMR